jgi:multidrug efflux pump
VDAALVGALQALPQLADVASDLQDRGLQAYVEIDRDAASRLGVAVADIDDTLYSAFGQAAGFHALHAHEPVPRRPRGGAAARGRSRIAVGPLCAYAAGKPVPLSSIARVSDAQLRCWLITSGSSPRLPFRLIWAAKHHLGEAVSAIERLTREQELPEAIEMRFQGAAHAFRSSLSSTLWLVLAAVVVMYIVLGGRTRVRFIR